MGHLALLEPPWLAVQLRTYGHHKSKYKTSLTPRIFVLRQLLYSRGLPMALYSLSAVASVGISATAAGWIEANPHMQWRWIQWIHVMWVLKLYFSFPWALNMLSPYSGTGLYTLSIPILMCETRSAVILTRRARKLRKETGDVRYRAHVEDERGSLRALIWISCTRPLCPSSDNTLT
jgi:hypothetical protein